MRHELDIEEHMQVDIEPHASYTILARGKASVTARRGKGKLQLLRLSRYK